MRNKLMNNILVRLGILAILSLSFGFALSCSSNGQSQVNPSFSAANDEEEDTLPTTAIDANNNEQVVYIEAGEDNQNGSIGLISKQSAEQVFCVIIDPKKGNNAELEVCEREKANQESDSVNGICPEADKESRCSSFNEGSGPDFCEVWGETDYVFVIMNLTAEDVEVAYQVIDVTDLENQSCADLKITEDSILVDDADDS